MTSIKQPRQRTDRRRKKDDSPSSGSGAVISREIWFPGASPERVWRALTQAGQLAKWLLPVSGGSDIVPTPGYRFAFAAPGSGGTIRCEVLEAEAGRRLAYTWQAAPDQPATVVTWTVERDATGKGARLFLQHEARPVTSPSLLLAGFSNGIGARLRDCLRTDHLSPALPKSRRSAQQQQKRRAFIRTGELLCL